VSLREQEVNLFATVLDPRKLDRINYVVLVRELMGVPQGEFILTGIRKLAEMAEQLDLSEP
jgi:hypothetical protein